MDKFIEKLNKLKSQVNLSAERKEDLYLKIINASLERKERIVARPVIFWGISRRTPTAIFAGFLGLMVITAGTSFASEGSLPGDVLYPVKRNINETVLGLLANTTQKRAELASNLVERRLSEATQLASMGRLTQEVSDTLSLEVEKTAQEARDQISSLQEDERDDLAIHEASHLETALRANSAVLRGVISKKEKEEPAVVASFNAKVEGLAMRAEDTRTSIENSMLPSRAMFFMAAKSVEQAPTTTTLEVRDSGKPTEEFTRESMDETVKSIEKFKEKVKEREKERTYNSEAVNRVIEDAEKDVEEARRNLEDEDINNSLILINQSNRRIGEAEIMNDAEKRLNIKVFEARDSNEDDWEGGDEGEWSN